MQKLMFGHQNTVMYVFLTIFTYLSTFLPKLKKESIPQDEQLFITLVCLRHNTSFDFLSHARGLKKATLVNYFWKWINLIGTKMNFIIKWPSQEVAFETNPIVFRKKFPRLTAIVDCFQIFVEKPKGLLAKALCYIQYKDIRL